MDGGRGELSPESIAHIKGDVMKSARIYKTTPVVGAAALILGAFIAGPADAKKK